jgi:hypothetical protein
MGIDFNRSRMVWHNQIVRWGGGTNNGKLVRAGASRFATMAMVEYTPRERGLFADGAVRFWISAMNVTAVNVPDENLDVLQFKGRQYKIILPPAGQQPDGTWIAFDCSCMFQSVI